jgi:DNA (cytosine-5)-methyltransferase 1
MFFEAVRIIKEMRDGTDGTLPRYALWENVRGAFTSNGGKDFGVVLDSLADIGAVAIEWHLVDSQFFGVPQRRRRVFVLACFDPSAIKRGERPIFPVGEGRRRDSSSGGKKRKGSPGASSDRVGDDRDSLIGTGTVGSLCARDWSIGSQYVNNNKVVVQPAISLLDGTRRDDVRIYDEPVQTLKERMGTGGNNVPLLFQDSEPILSFDTQFGSNANVFEDSAPTLKSSQAAPSVLASTSPFVFQPGAMVRQGLPGSEEVAPTLRAEGKSGDNMPYVLADTFDGAEVTHSLTTRAAVEEDGTGRGVPIVGSSFVVRRLTPVECERLQGWPDNHTLYRADGKTNTDTARYKMCGNGVTANVAEWLAYHLAIADDEARS